MYLEDKRQSSKLYASAIFRNLAENFDLSPSTRLDLERILELEKT